MQGPNTRHAAAATARARRSHGQAPRACGLALSLAFASVGSVQAQSDPNPYYIGLSEALTHNTNINNVTGGPSDTYSSTGLLGGFDQSIGRQHVYGSANVTLNRYRTFDQLNNTSYGVYAGWDWQTIGRLSGTVNTSITQSLATLQNNLLQVSAGDNQVRTQQLGTRAKWGGDAAISVQGGFGYSKTTYSTPSLQAGDSDSSSADIGVYYQPGPTLTLGTALRFTRSNADAAFQLADGTLLSNRTTGRNIDLSANWNPTPVSGATARISFTKQSDSTGGDGFSGITGALGFTYAPTGKLSFAGQYTRDAATNGNFYNTFTGTTGQSLVGLASSNSVSDGLSLTATYLATGKVTANANVGYRRTRQDASGFASNSGYTDSFTNYGLGATWAIRRFWSASCSVSRIQRRLSGAYNYDYDGNTYSCSTQVTLR